MTINRNKSEHHNKWATRDGHIGIVQSLSWNDTFRFHDLEANKFEDLASLEGITVHEDKPGRAIYEERNHPKQFFDGHRYIGKPEDGHTDRQKSYGLLHDNQLECAFENGTNGIWSDNFSRGIASVAAQKAIKEDTSKGALAHMMGDGSTYEVWCNKMFLAQATDEEITGLLVEAHSLDAPDYLTETKEYQELAKAQQS